MMVIFLKACVGSMVEDKLKKIIQKQTDLNLIAPKTS